MASSIHAKGQREKKDLTLVEFQGVNVQAKRIAIKDNQFSWLENAMPIGPGNLAITPQISAILATITAGQSITASYSVNINGTDFIFAFTSTGAGYAINIEAYGPNPAYTVNKFANAATFSGTGITMTAWNNQRVMIGDPGNGLFTWDTNNLTKNGQGIFGTGAIVNGGHGYTSNPTVTVYPNGGAQITVTVSGGAVTGISLVSGGSGYTSAPTIFIIGGGGTGATISVTIVDGLVAQATITAGGSGYLFPPNVYVCGGGPPGSGMTAGATETGGVVTTLSITAAGSGYLLNPFPIITGGGGADAIGTVQVLAGPTQISAIAAFSGRLWCSFARTVNISDVNSYSSFAGAGTSFTISDETLYNNVTQLVAANSFLYIFGSSSIDILGNVSVSGGVTTFTRTNVTASIGSNLPFTIYPYYRAIVFADQIGFYALSGATPEKISDDLDRLYNAIVFTSPVSGGQVALNNILCAAFMFTFVDNFVGTGNSRPLLALFFNKKWFFASQASSNPLNLLVPVNLNGVPVLYGWDTNNNLYQLFFSTTAAISSTVQTKLYDGKNILLDKESQKVGVGLTFQSSMTQSSTVTVNGENNSSTSQTLAGGNILQFVNNLGNNIQFQNNSFQNIFFTIGGYFFLKSDFQLNNQKYLGLTVTSSSPGVIYSTFAIEYEEGASW